MDNVGFVGASGLMGRGMAQNIRRAGFPLAYTVHRTPVSDLDEAGATRAVSNADLGAGCDVVVICVTAAEDVDRVVTGPEGLLARPKPGLVIIDASTSEPSTTLRLAEAAAARGASVIDAPLTRGPKEAAEGRLNSLVGADDATFERVRPVIESYSENVFRTGPVGSGHTIKLLNNFCVQAAATALSEAFAVAATVGADPQTLVDVLGAGMFDNQLLAIMERTLHGDFGGMTFALANARKDVRYYTRLAGEHGVPAVVGDGVHESLALACAMGVGQEFVPSMVKGQALLNSVEISAGHDAR